MWFKVNISREVEIKKDKKKVLYETFLLDVDNFAEAGYRVMQYYEGDCEVEDVMLMKTLKPAANDKFSDTNKLFIVKFAEDFKQDDGTIKTMKYPVPFFADSSVDLQEKIHDYMLQGLQDMRVTTISETKWDVI